METPYTVCAAILATVQAELEACGAAPGTALIGVGGLAVNDCCGGLLTVAPERVYPTVQFPFQKIEEDGREVTLAIDVVVRMDRCVPVILPNGEAPPVAEQEAGMLEALRDAAIIWRAVRGRPILGYEMADDPDSDPLWERANVVQTFQGPDGGCVGSETRFTIGLPIYDWCVEGCG